MPNGEGGRRGREQALIEAVPDSYVEGLTASGTPDDVGLPGPDLDLDRLSQTAAEAPRPVRVAAKLLAADHERGGRLDHLDGRLVLADLHIGRLYLRLGGRPDLAARIVDEHRRTVDLVLEVRGTCW